MILELSDTVPTQPGHYFGRLRTGDVIYIRITMSTGDELWNRERYSGLVFNCARIDTLGVVEWSEKILFRVTQE